jgi:N-acetylmuramoyl-L-alanine amidase
VSKKNAQYKKSVIFAHLLGKELRKLGRPPTLHHAENIPGENRKLINKSLGIYEFNELAVLQKNTAPAVLLEVGVIVDPIDEEYVNSTDNQKRIIFAVKSAVEKFFYEPPRRASWVKNETIPLSPYRKARYPTSLVPK